MTNNILLISTEKLIPHPDNPRKELGDLTELADSIREQGIFQNLTVVPANEDRYTVIIGHRRLAAAKLAGLEKVPCAVVEMDENTQYSTMLLENMQRTDLTVLEQAEGIHQLQLRGFSIDEIKKKTGLSRATINDRLKIAALPKDGTAEAYQRGATLAEYVKISELEDETEKTKILEYAGTKDFDWQHAQALRRQYKKRNTATANEIITKYAIKEIPKSKVWSDEYPMVKIFSYDTEDFDAQGFEQGIRDYSDEDLYYSFRESAIWLYRKVAKKKNKKPKKSKAEIRADEARAALAEKFETAYNLRKSFCDNFSAFKRYKSDIDRFLLIHCAMFAGEYLYNFNKIIAEKAGCKDIIYINQDFEDKYKSLQTFCQKPEAAFTLCVALLNDSEERNCMGWSCGAQMPPYQNSYKLQRTYEFLVSLGYRISTEEQQLLDGTHELYAKG